jgi:hypothetical protein
MTPFAAPVFFLPAVVRLFGDAELSTDIEHSQSFASFPGSGPVPHSS